jgi:hypothetical protein
MPTLDKMLLAEAELAERQENWGEAAAAYSKMIENGIENNNVLYSYARDSIKTGLQAKKIKGLEVLRKLSKRQIMKNSNDFWIELAKETLANTETENSVLKNAKEGKND